jgi:hypothetical protein
MNSFINIKKTFDPTINYWELNPHLIYMKPYSTLYNEDKSKDKTESSKTMWCITWLIDPDEDTNKYFRLPEDQRLEICKEFHSSFDYENELIQEIMVSYPEDCLTIIERSLRDTKEFIRKRDKFIKTQDYNLSTMKELDDAAAKTIKIFQDYEKIEKQFLEYKSKGVRIKGGRNQTIRESGRIEAK